MKRPVPVGIVALLYASIMFGVWQWSIAAGLWMFGLLSFILILLVEYE